MWNLKTLKGIKHTLNIKKVFFSLQQKNETHIHNWNIYLFSFTNQSFTPLLSTPQSTDWIFFWMLNLLVKSLMDWSQWQNAYSNLMGPEIWFLTCIISSLNFVSGKVIPKYELLFQSSWHPPTPAAVELTMCNHIWCSNLPAIWNPTINSYHGTGSVFDKAVLPKCIINSDFIILWNACLDCERERAITNAYGFMSPKAVPHRIFQILYI